MPTNFERAASVIENLLPVAEQLVHGDLDEYITSRLRALSHAYGNALLRDNRSAIDYTKLTTHVAYCYRALAAHGDWNYKLFKQVRTHISQALNRYNPVRVACIGGGPGSDLLGLLKFALDDGLIDHPFDFTILDRERKWNRARAALVATFDGEVEIAQTFQNLDVTDDGNWTNDWDFCHSNIFTFSFFLSEVWSFNGDGCVSRFMQRVLDSAQNGALFCYIDNGGDNFTPLVEAEFARPDMELITSRDLDRIVVGTDEQCDVLTEPYKVRFGNQMPKLVGNVSMRVWKKICA